MPEHNPPEHNFLNSWDWREAWYRKQIDEHNHLFLLPLLDFIRELRSLGYDEAFYLHRFGIHPILSTSEKLNQDAIMEFRLEAVGAFAVRLALYGKVYNLRLEKPAVTPELRALLELFACHSADEREGEL